MTRKTLEDIVVNIDFAAAIAAFVLGFFVFFPRDFIGPFDHLLHTTRMKDFTARDAALEECFLDTLKTNRTFQLTRAGIFRNSIELHIALCFDFHGGGVLINFLY